MRPGCCIAPYEDALTSVVRQALYIAIASHQHRTSETNVEFECHLGICSRRRGSVRLPIACSSPALMRSSDATGYVFTSGITHSMMNHLQLAVLDAKLACPYDMSNPRSSIKLIMPGGVRLIYEGEVDEMGIYRTTLRQKQVKSPARTEEISGGSQWGADVRLGLCLERALHDWPPRQNGASADGRAADEAGVVYTADEVWPGETPSFVYLQQRRRIALHPYFTLDLSCHDELVDFDRLRLSRDGRRLDIRRSDFHERRTSSHVEVEVEVGRVSRMWRRLTGAYCKPLPPDYAPSTPRQPLLPGGAAVWRSEEGDPFLRRVAQELLTLLQFLTDPRHLGALKPE